MNAGIHLLLFVLSVQLTALQALTTTDIHHYFWANYEQFGGNRAHALQWYHKVFDHEVPAYAYKGYLSFLYDIGNNAEILALLPRLEQPFKKDPDVQLIFARTLERTGHKEKSHAKILELAREFTTHQEIIFSAAAIYLAHKEPENALAAIDGLLNNSPRRQNNFIFYFTKAQILISLNKHEEALANVKTCLDMHPGFPKGWLMLALLEEQQGRLTEAIKGYTTFLQTNGERHQQLEQHLAQLLLKQQVAHRAHIAALSNKSAFDRALYFYEQQQWTQALDALTVSLKEKAYHEEALLLKIEILSHLHDQSALAQLFTSWLTHDPDNETALKTLHLYCRKELTNQKALGLLTDITKKHPQALRPLLYLIDFSLRTNAYDSAAMYCHKALALTPDVQLKTRLLFHVAVIYYEQNKLEQAQAALEEGYALKTNFPPLLNLLAYYYATGAKDLQRAQELINQARVDNKNNPHFLDTQALIYYKQKKYPQALALLEEIVQQLPQDFSVLKHLSKTYYRLGNETKALATLEQAHTCAHTDYEKQQCSLLKSCWQK